MLLSTFIVPVLLACAYSKSNGDHESLRLKLRSSSLHHKIQVRETPTAHSARLEVTSKNPVENSQTTSSSSKPAKSVSESGDPDSYAGIIDHVRGILRGKIQEASVNEDEKNNTKSSTESGEQGGEKSAGYLEDEKSRDSKDGNEKETAEKENATESNVDKELSFGNSQDKSLEKAVFRKTGGNSSLEERSSGGIISAEQKDDAERSHNVTVGATIKEIIDDESRNGGGAFVPDEEDLREAANFGLKAMHDLYYVKEPQLFSMGLYLDSDNPARYVAAFNDQTEEARALSKYGFAVLQGATMFMRKFPDASNNLILSRQRQGNPLQQSCPSRGTPVCPQASLRYRTSDGSCNNQEHLWWGSAMSTMQRFLSAVYQDGIQMIRRSKTGRPLPSAREISNVIHEDKDVSLASVTHMLMQWGQFVDHDITATGQSRGFNGTIPQCCLNIGAGFQSPDLMHPECLPISVSPQDTFYGPLAVRCLEFLRSGSAPREDCEFGPREQLSQVTSYLDASTVYSSNAFQSDSLRLFRNGLLQYGRIQSRRPLLPRRESDLCKRGSLSTTCFRAGDGRLSEQPALTSLHVVFLRLHNRIATKLAAVNSHWGDEKLFQETRKIVGAIVQHITYREFLPIILGQEVMKIFDLEVLKKGYYEGYDPTVNPTIANGFSTAAYRFGHSLVQRSFVRFDGHHNPIFNNVSIHDEFSNPVNLETAGSVDRLLLGLVNQPSQRRDEYITEELTNHLFQTPRFPFGMDLAALNIQRGRDHGIPPYVKWRRPCGLSSIRSFEDLNRVMPATAVRKFRQLYSSVEDIDLFPAGLAEHSVAGGLVGPTFACIIGQQFNNLRRGDRFWYENSGIENSFTPGQLQQIRRVSLAQILCRTMDNIDTIQPFVFLTQDTLKNERVPCNDPAIGKFNLEFWAEEPLELRSNVNFGKADRKAASQPKSSNAKSSTSTKVQAGAKISAQNSVDQSKIVGQRPKPVKANINQQNRIVVKRPLGPPDNVTIVVQNNAVNSPVFVSDAVHGSNLKIQPSAQFQSQSTQGPSFDIIDRRPTYQSPAPPIINIPSLNGPKPIPTSVPLLVGFKSDRPYIPHAYGDPSNPNPLNHGFQLASYPTHGVVFESFSATSPRPTLYTYYTNGQQKPTTQRPQYQINDRLDSHKPQVQHRPSGQSYVTPKPSSSSWSNLEPNRGLNDQATYQPIYGVPASSQLHNSGGNKPDDWHQLQDQYRPINSQHDAAVWNSPNHPNRPSVRPIDQQSGAGYWNPENYQNRPNSQNRPLDQQFGYQERPVTNGPFNQENLGFYQTKPNVKPPNHNDHIMTLSSDPYPAGLIKEPSNQHNPEIGAPHQMWPDSRPVQADPDGWSTIPSYQKPSANKPLGYHDAPPYQSVSTGNPSHSPPSGSFFSYQNGPTIKPVIIENKLTNVPSYHPSSSNNFATQSSWPDAPPYKKNPPKQPATNLNKFQELQSPPSYQKPTIRPFGPNDQPYQSQDDHDDLKNVPVYQTSIKPLPNDNRINIQTYTLGPIRSPSSSSGNPGNNQLSKKPPSRPASGGLDSLLSNLGYQTSARPEFSYSQSHATNAGPHKTAESANSKPSKVHSVTIVTETIETIKQSDYPADRLESKVTSEVPRPLLASAANIDKPATRKPGQYYYEKNVLHRYPDETEDQIPKQDYYSLERKNAVEQSRNKVSQVQSALGSVTNDSTNSSTNSSHFQNVSDVTQNSDDKMTHPSIETSNAENHGDDVYYDLDEAFSEEAESATVSYRTNHWLNPEEDSRLPSTLEMPKISSKESAVVKELPSPITGRNHAS